MAGRIDVVCELVGGVSRTAGFELIDPRQLERYPAIVAEEGTYRRSA